MRSDSPIALEVTEKVDIILDIAALIPTRDRRERWEVIKRLWPLNITELDALLDEVLKRAVADGRAAEAL